MLVLLVDDNDSDRVLYRSVLESHGHDVILADSAAGVTKACQEGLPDVIVLDGVLPGMDGFELCRTLKRRQEFQVIPILIQSAMDEHEARARAMDAGATAFVPKAGNWEVLLAAIEAACPQQP